MATEVPVPVLRLNSVAIEDGEEEISKQRSRSRSPSNCSSASASEYFQSSDTESTCSDRSGSNSKRSSENEGLTEEQRAEVIQKLVAQVEFLFSEEHLTNDGFLLKHIRRRSDGFVSLKLVAGLRKVKQISRDFSLVVEALRLSLKLDVNLEGTKVRRMDPLSEFLLNLSLNTEKKTKDNPAVEFTEAELANRLAKKNQKAKNSDENTSPSRSPMSSNASSRHGSFSKQQRPGQKSSLPISISAQNSKNSSPDPRRKNLFLSPNSSPRSSSFGNKEDFQLQRGKKSSSYSDGLAMGLATQGEVSVTGTSAWLEQRRKSSSENALNSGDVANSIIRQPLGPDGTKGFALMK